MDERFDPAVRSILKAIGHSRGSTASAELVGTLVLRGEPGAAALTRDPDRLKTILDQLVDDGLALKSASGYELTDLGRARVDQLPDDED